MTRTTRAIQVLTLLLVALTMALEFTHVLELGPKLNYPPELYLRLNTSLYAWFGPPLGAVIYLGAIVATGTLAWVVRRRRVLTGASFALQVMAFVTFLTLIEPVNVRFRARLPGEVPADFTALRSQWEYTHVLGFVLFAVAFLLLVIALLVHSTARPHADAPSVRVPEVLR